MIASNTGPEGVISSTIRVTDSASAMPRTRSALPTRSSGPVPTGCAAANVSEAYGVCQICIGWIRLGSSVSWRKAISVPSSNSEYPWQAIGVATSLRITLYGSRRYRPAARAWNTYSTSSPLTERITRSYSRSVVSASNVFAAPVAR